MNGKGRKKIGKVILWLVIGFLLLDLTIVGLLFVPTIQTFVVNKVTNSLSEQWGSDLSIKDVHITPTLKLVLHEVKIGDHHQNDMIAVSTLKGRLRALSLKPFKLKFGTLELDDANVVLRTYSGEDKVNISIWAKNFKKKERQGNYFLLSSKKLKMTNSRFVLINDDKRVVTSTDQNPDIDYAFLELTDLLIDADEFKVESSDVVTIAMKFNHLALNQYGGFSLTDGQADFSICDTSMVFRHMHFVTPRSNLNTDLAFRYADWSTLGDFVDSVHITSTIRSTTLNMQDVAAFAPALKGMDETLSLTADRFDGTVNDFTLINLLAHWGMGTTLHGDLALQNVSDFQNAFITLELDSSTVNVPDLANFTLPKGKTIPINKTLAKLGKTTLRCSFAGTISEFDTQLDAHSGLGSLFANLGSSVDQGKMYLKGSVTSPNLKVGRLIGQTRIVNSANLFASFEGDMDSDTWSAEGLQTLAAHLNGEIRNINLFGYNLKNTYFDGDFANNLYNGNFKFNDPHFDCDILAQLDLSENVPALQGNISLDHLNAGSMANSIPAIDSATAKGFDKLLYSVQQNPSLQISFSNFMIALRGQNVNDVNGYAGCDNIRIISNEDSTDNDRMRLTAINTSSLHKYILSSAFANASLETTYTLQELPNLLRAFMHKHFPTLFEEAPTQVHELIATNPNGYVKANMTSYRTHNITKLISPNLFIAPNSTIDVAISNDHTMDKLEAHLPLFGFRERLMVRDLVITGKYEEGDYLQLDLTSDSTRVTLGNTHLVFKDINLDARAQNDSIYYRLNWNDNLNNVQVHQSQLMGTASLSNPDDLILTFQNSNLYVNDTDWQINNNNAIHLQNGHSLVVKNLKMQNENSNIEVNGTYAKNSNEQLRILVNRLNIAIINSLLNGMELDGKVSADITLISPNNRTFFFGKALIDEFAFNQELIGDLYAVAALDTSNCIPFLGGIFPLSAASEESSLNDFTISTLQQTGNLIAKIDGQYATNKKDLKVHALFDTLNAGFLASFLSGFSNQFTGTASGDLYFYSNPEATYFDGTVHAIDINMGIAPLGTQYNIKDQDIKFDSEGILFQKIRITDKEGNIAYMTGDIKHNFFRDMEIDLKITTDRIMALNTPKDATSLFYGDGFVSGEVYIQGNNNVIYFKGPNLTTLSGTRITLQITSANSTSQSDVIHFTPKQSTTKNTTEKTRISSNSSTKLDFDFTFNVTNDADIVLYLESIGGTLNARADGKFRLTYNDNDDVNLEGNLALHSGDFRIALYNVVNSKFTLVSGGNIQFDGPLENMQVNVSAYKTSKTSLADIIPQENIGNVNVNAYIHLNGPLMQRIEPTFSFELPNSSEEVNNLFYTAIDTTNTENLTKQFVYFLVTNSFSSSNSSNAGSTGSAIGASGINMFKNIVNNMLGSIIDSRNGSFGITYNQATETSSAEYGVTGSANLLKDRITVETSIGYYDDQTSQGINNMYGDFSVVYNINKEGTWTLKAYTYLGERDENYVLHSDQINYTAGVALAYKQDFNTNIRKRNKNKKLKKQKTSHEQ